MKKLVFILPAIFLVACTNPFSYKTTASKSVDVSESSTVSRTEEVIKVPSTTLETPTPVKAVIVTPNNKADTSTPEKAH
jgi:hypothetical protein